MRQEFLTGTHETIAIRSNTSAMFVDYIHHFQEKERAGTNHLVLLLLGNHCAHLSGDAINAILEHSILMT
jgi:hypothetical protein